MTITVTVHDTSVLLGILRDNKAMEPPTRYWLDLAFPSVMNFDDEYIDFSKLSNTRKLAPLVVPTAQGKPIYTAAERLTRVKPAYLKPKDPVSASRVVRRAAGLGELGATEARKLTPQQRYNAIVVDILKQHRYAIERRWEWMAAEAIINGSVTLEDEAYPLTVVDFNRDAGHTVTLGGGVQWGDAGVSIVESIETMRETVRDAAFGGPITRITVGSDVWKVMRKDDEIKGLLDNNFRLNSGAELKMGLLSGSFVERIGKLSDNLELYVYSDYYNLPNGTVQPFMSKKDIVLTGPEIQGVKAFGAIQDINAQFQPLAIFPKMWNQEDPSATFVMSQSAPLMVPVNPNNTFKATVVA